MQCTLGDISEPRRYIDIFYISIIKVVDLVMFDCLPTVCSISSLFSIYLLRANTKLMIKSKEQTLIFGPVMLYPNVINRWTLNPQKVSIRSGYLIVVKAT